ncbi:MAG: hypothetical protein K0Q79_273 [Flavipsychrobacter sp.]|jgi:hypothetical protein|nr:hypothetical protein [Flavipsychrobacter sp.]
MYFTLQKTPSVFCMFKTCKSTPALQYVIKNIFHDGTENCTVTVLKLYRHGF